MIDFPHIPPRGYTYEVHSFKRNVVSIWICNHNKFSYTNDSPVKSIWGFYNQSKKQYLAPVNSKTPGKVVSFKDTTPYSAMPLLKVAQSFPQEQQNDLSLQSNRETPMTATLNKEFSDFCAQRDAQNTIELNIVKYGLMLCDALQQDFQKRNYAYRAGLPHSNYSYELSSDGRKYHKIHMCINGKRDSIHCFIDKKTGEIYKPASTKQPAKGVRFNLLLIKDREYLLENADWAGGYLYLR